MPHFHPHCDAAMNMFSCSTNQGTCTHTLSKHLYLWPQIYVQTIWNDTDKQETRGICSVTYILWGFGESGRLYPHSTQDLPGNFQQQQHQTSGVEEAPHKHHLLLLRSPFLRLWLQQPRLLPQPVQLSDTYFLTCSKQCN